MDELLSLNSSAAEGQARTEKEARAGGPRIAFFGTSEFAVPILERLAASPWRPALVVTTPDAPAGRSLEPKPPPVKVAAGRLGIPVIQPQKLEIENLRPEIPGADLFVLAAYGKILPAGLLALPKRGALNVHPSLLPRWRGASPIQAAILHGDAETGVTIILMDEQVDHGAILESRKWKVESRIATPELTRQLARMGADLLLETVPKWLAGEIVPQPQDHSKATFTKRLRKEDGRIDWSRPAEEIEPMARALQPWPGAYTFWRRGGKQVRLAVEEAETGNQLPATGTAPPGTVAAIGTGPAVQTGRGWLILARLKPEGARSMSGAEFLRGHRDIIGAILQ